MKWSILWVGLYGKLIYDFITPLGISPQSPVFDCPDPTRTEQILNRIIKIPYTDSFREKILCISYIYELFASLAEDNEVPEKLMANILSAESSTDHVITYHSDNITIRQAENYIRFHYDKEITINEIAAEAHLEPSYFSRLFKKETGFSPKQQIIQYRIQKACDLLKTTNLTVEEISSCVGFPDALYFSRLFRKKKNMSPSMYRKKHTKRSS